MPEHSLLPAVFATPYLFPQAFRQELPRAGSCLAEIPQTVPVMVPKRAELLVFRLAGLALFLWEAPSSLALAAACLVLE